MLAEVQLEVVVLLAAFFHEPLDAGFDFGPGEGFQESGVGGRLVTSGGYVAAGVEDFLGGRGGDPVEAGDPGGESGGECVEFGVGDRPVDPR